MNYSDLPPDIVHHVLQYDGRIKYHNGKYVNIIHKYDKRYNILRKYVDAKINICNHAITDRDNNFYLEFSFKNNHLKGLCVSNGSFTAGADSTMVETCYFNFENNNVIQFRSYI